MENRRVNHISAAIAWIITVSGLILVAIIGLFVWDMAVSGKVPLTRFEFAAVAVVSAACIVLFIFAQAQLVIDEVRKLKEQSAGQTVVNGYSLAVIAQIINCLRNSIRCSKIYQEMIRDEKMGEKFDTGFSTNEQAAAEARTDFPNDMQTDLNHLAKWLGTPARKHYTYEELMAFLNLAEAEIRRHSA